MSRARSAGPDFVPDVVMAEVEQRQSGEMPAGMALDTTMYETTGSSRPVSEQEIRSPTNSGSDYSQSPSPTKSRPTSGRPESAANAFEEISLLDNSQEQRESGSHIPIIEASDVSRPASALPEGIAMGADVEEELPPSPIDSGSDYSEPSTPNVSRPTSMHPAAAGESLPIEDNSETPIASASVRGIEQKQPTPTKNPSQQWNSLTQLNQSSRQSDIQVDTPSSRPQSFSLSQSVPSEPPTPTITVSPHPDSPEGSDYSGSAPASPRSPSTPTVPISPMTPQEAHMSIDSMQSIALSELSQDFDHLSADEIDDVLSTPRVSGVRHLRKPSSLEILQNNWGPLTRQSTFFDTAKDEPLGSPIEGPEESEDDLDTSAVWRTESSSSSLAAPKRDSDSFLSDVEVDWSTLDRTEEQEKEDKDLPEGAEDESTAFLLARLEQENAKFTADPKSAISKNVARVRSKSRPPSMAQLKKLVSQSDAPSIRYSMSPDMQQPLPEDPPPMTELEFWAALVQDYPSTASRLPTLTTTKIRAGIPPPLRGVVWTSMSGARDKHLEEAFETLQHEKSPYEGIINKDVGRSFPGVELFRDAEGEGQKMLGRVLRCFSLHDKDIGYCQGLGFLVGPLLMNMGERDAFCVLVR